MLSGQWYQTAESNSYQAHLPRRTPLTFKMERGFCDVDSKSKFLVTGYFLNKPNPDSISPQIIFEVNSTTEVFHLDFRQGSKHIPTTYFAWSKLFNQNLTVRARELPELQYKQLFNLSITCREHSTSGQWKIRMNYWDPQGDPNGLVRNPADWDMNYYVNTTLNPNDVQNVYVIGHWQPVFAGFTASSCLGLGSNGLIIEGKGEGCERNRDYLCEYQSCSTTEGFACIFPFKYKGVEYKKCISEDVYKPWCPTRVEGDVIKDWGLCLDDCDHFPPEASCLTPPPVPLFGNKNKFGNIERENYEASWFSLTFLETTEYEKQKYVVSRAVRKKLYQPWMKYNSAELYERNLRFVAQDQFDHFNDVYEIVPENGKATYTCPLGWVFEGTKNVTQTAVCEKWEWNVLFNTSLGCVPVVCPEEELPPFPENSANGTTNVEEVKAENATHWNSWQGTVTYTCPPGYVLEAPGRHDEQDDPIPDDEEVRSFSVQCGDNAVWTPVTTFGSGKMPRCIPINCTEIPFPVRNNDLGSYNWTGIDGQDPKPYATKIRYFCPKHGWGFPSTGERMMFIQCEMDGYWSNQFIIEECMKLPCPDQPPDKPDGPGAARIYNPQITQYKCQNGFMFEDGSFPFLGVECLNRKWRPQNLPKCIPRKCSELEAPIGFKGHSFMI